MDALFLGRNEVKNRFYPLNEHARKQQGVTFYIFCELTYLCITSFISRIIRHIAIDIDPVTVAPGGVLIYEINKEAEYKEDHIRLINSVDTIRERYSKYF